MNMNELNMHKNELPTRSMIRRATPAQKFPLHAQLEHLSREKLAPTLKKENFIQMYRIGTYP